MQAEYVGLYESWRGSEIVSLGRVFDLKLDTTHEYSLRMRAKDESCEDSQQVKMTASISVPEPASMLLLVSSLIGLLGLRRKFKKS